VEQLHIIFPPLQVEESIITLRNDERKILYERPIQLLR